MRTFVCLTVLVLSLCKIFFGIFLLNYIKYNYVWSIIIQSNLKVSKWFSCVVCYLHKNGKT